MKPRFHNLLSYGLALFVFVGVAMWRVATGAASGALAELGVEVGVAMWCFHFARRSAESAFVHRYGKPSVPLGDVLTEYAYYWGFAAWNAWSLFAGSYQSPGALSVALGALLFVAAELGNAKAHRMLRDLRAPGSAARVIPRGFLFERVSSPHYLFEILSWLGFALATRTWAAWCFLALGTGILGAWARQRHLAYLKEFDGREGRASYPPERKALVPGVF